MDWMGLGVVSAVFLGLYDLAKKRSVDGNAVLPVLFLASLISAGIWLPGIVGSLSPWAERFPEWMQLQPLGWRDHLLLFAKSGIVTISWIATYFAIKHLPVSIASPIRSTAPLWTLAGALLIYREVPGLLQGLGIGITLAGFIAFSVVGRMEGIRFEKNQWVYWMVFGTLMGSISGLYDKFLFAHCGFTAATTQAWFSCYLVVALALPAWGWKHRWWPRSTFHWRWSILLVSLFLLAADYAYFQALTDPDAMIAILSCIRRGNLLIAFAVGSWIFKERHFLRKLPCVLAIFAGIVLILLG